MPSLMLSFAVSISLSQYIYISLAPFSHCDTCLPSLFFPFSIFFLPLQFHLTILVSPFIVFLSPEFPFQSPWTHSHVPFIPSLWLISIGQHDLRAPADHFFLILVFLSHRTLLLFLPVWLLCSTAALSSVAWAANRHSQHIISKIVERVGER